MKSFIVSAALICSATAHPAIAHAVLERAVPHVGSTVKAAPAEVSLWLTERLEPAFSTIRVFDENGERVDESGSHLDSQNDKQLTIALKPMGPGTYRVVWRVVSVDTHASEGAFKFTIAP